MKPIKPSEVGKAKKVIIPGRVIKAFNHLIAKNWNGHSSTILQKEVVALIMNYMDLHNSNEIFENHWLDVEDIYRDAGWRVVFDKPAYCETYEASFKFSK